MKINENQTPNTQAKDVPVGACCRYNDVVWLRLRAINEDCLHRDVQHDICMAALENGVLDFFAPDTIVTPVYAEVFVK